MSIKASASDYCEVDGIRYVVYKTEGGYSASVVSKSESGSDYSGAVTIHSTIKYNNHEVIVTDISYQAFFCCTGLTSVTISNGLEYIGEEAFYGCSSLTSINIPTSVTAIGDGAFWNCSNLASVEISSGVTYIGSAAFSNCGCESVIISSDNPVYDSRDNCNAIIETATNTLLYGFKNTIIPNSVDSIRPYAFYDCSGLTSIEIPGSVTNIGEAAFSQCEELESVIIHNGVSKIGEHAFSECPNLYTIELPNSITEIEPFTFSHSGLYSITLPNNLTSIGACAFYHCSNLEEIELPYSVDYIYGGAFDNCEFLKKITIPNSEIIIYSAFENCWELRSIYISDIEAWCKKSFGSNFIYSSYDLYLNDELVTEIVVPNSVDSIGNGAFRTCRSLNSVILPNSVKHIGRDAFYSCSNLTSINIPNSVTSIETSVFASCFNLTSIDIPNSVTKIGQGAFYDCSGLTSVIVHWKQPILLDMSYGGPFNKVNYSDVTLYVPVGTVDAYRQADGWNQFVNIVESSETRISLSDDLISYYNTEEVLDFSQIGTEENVLKAYVATGFDGETVTLEEVKIVPANTAVILMGKAKNTYTIPFYKSPKATKDASKSPSLNESGEINYLRGVEETTTIYPTDGEKMNFVLADGDEGRRFYSVQKEGIKVSVGEAYLQLSASLCPEGISSLSLQFKDDDSSDIINLNVTNASGNEMMYNLSGQQITIPQPGVNILRMSDGSVKKVMVK